MSELYFFLLDGGNDENQLHYGAYNFYFLKSATLNQDPTGCIEDYIFENHGEKKKTKKAPKSYDV
jgi:hypothetical protein